MTTQIWYQTNIDFDATYDKLYDTLQSNPKDVYPLESVRSTGQVNSLLEIRFKKSEPTFLISSYGRMWVTWENADQKRILFNELRKLVVPLQGEKLKIRPIKQQTLIPYPPPEDLKLYWCSEKTEYMKYDSMLLLLVEQELLKYYREAPTQ